MAVEVFFRWTLETLPKNQESPSRCHYLAARSLGLLAGPTHNGTNRAQPNPYQ